MSLQQNMRPLIIYSRPIAHFTASLSGSTSRACLRRPRTLQRPRSTQQRQATRCLSTVPAYHPHSLDSAPPPPRNTNVPETSIAEDSPGFNNTRLSRQASTEGTPKQASEASRISESEAQKSIPAPESTTKPERKSRLRSRKAAMALTPSATAQLRNLLNLPEPKYIRVGVKNRGCSGLAYHLEYVDKAAPFDEAVEQDGVKVLIDSKALFSIIGSEMDWVEDKLNQRFVFRNPNISKLESNEPPTIAKQQD